MRVTRRALALAAPPRAPLAPPSRPPRAPLAPPPRAPPRARAPLARAALPALVARELCRTPPAPCGLRWSFRARGTPCPRGLGIVSPPSCPLWPEMELSRSRHPLALPSRPASRSRPPRTRGTPRPRGSGIVSPPPCPCGFGRWRVRPRSAPCPRGTRVHRGGAYSDRFAAAPRP